MKFKKISFYLCLSFFLFCLASLKAQTSHPESKETAPIVTDYPPSDASSSSDLETESGRRKYYKTAAAVVIATLISATIGLLVSSSDTGREANASSS